jgi:hypothetical protein
MKSQIRPATIFFVIVMLGALAILPALNLTKGENYVPDSGVVAAICGVLFVSSCLAIIWFTKTIEVDEISSIVKVSYPFRFTSSTFDFDEVQGFRYKYLTAKVDYKAIQLKLSNGKIYTISDFETGNLRAFERMCQNEFELKGENFKTLTSAQQKSEIKNSHAFDVEQAKGIRFFLFLGYAILGFIVFMTIKDCNEMGDCFTAIKLVIIMISISLASILTKKLLSIQKLLKSPHLNKNTICESSEME